MKKQLLDTLRSAKDYTLAVAEAMPEKDYTFKPQGAGWNFAELPCLSEVPGNATTRIYLLI